MTPQLFCEYGRCAEAPIPGSRFCARHTETIRKLSEIRSKSKRKDVSVKPVETVKPEPADLETVNILSSNDPRCPVCRKPFDSRLLCACKMSDEQARLDYQQRFAGNGRGAYRTQTREREG